MNIEEIHRLVNEYYNDKYSELYGYITKEASYLYYQKYAKDFIQWLEDVNEQSASEIILFALCEHEINYDIMIDKLDKEGHYTEENQSLFKTIQLEPKIQEIEDDNITIRESSNIIEL